MRLNEISNLLVHSYNYLREHPNSPITKVGVFNKKGHVTDVEVSTGMWEEFWNEVLSRKKELFKAADDRMNKFIVAYLADHFTKQSLVQQAAEFLSSDRRQIIRDRSVTYAAAKAVNKKLRQ